MKILILTDYIGKDKKGGSWEFAYKFGKYASQKIDATIVTFKPDDKQELPDFELEENLKIYRFANGKLFIPAIKEIEHDIAFVHDAKSFIVYRLSIGLKKKPIISMIQGTSYLERLINSGYKDLKYYALRLFELYRIKSTDILFFASKYMMINTVRNFSAFRKSTYLPLAIDYPVKNLSVPKDETHIKDMVTADIKEGYKIIFCIRRIVARTGVLNLVDMMKYLENEKIKLYIGGTGPYIEDLKEKLVKHGLSEKIVVLGLISDAAKNWLYSKSFLSVVPTLYLEGFCLSMVESMNYGCPPIVTPVGGMYEFMKDNGLDDLISIDSLPQSLAAATKKLLDNPKLRDKYSQICKEVAAKYYYPEIVDRFLREISYMLEKNFLG